MTVFSYPFEAEEEMLKMVHYLSGLKQDCRQRFYLFLNDLNIVNGFDY